MDVSYAKVTSAMLGSRGSGQKFCNPRHFNGLEPIGNFVKEMFSGVAIVMAGQLTPPGNEPGFHKGLLTIGFP